MKVIVNYSQEGRLQKDEYDSSQLGGDYKNCALTVSLVPVENDEMISIHAPDGSFVGGGQLIKRDGATYEVV